MEVLSSWPAKKGAARPSRSTFPWTALSTSRLSSSTRMESCDINGMTTDTAAPSYKGFRFPQEIFSHTVWLYFRFNLSYRDVEELLAARGVTVTYETIR